MEFKDKVFTTEETAEHLQVSKQTIFNLIHAEKLRASKVGKHWRIRGQAINEYLTNEENKANK